MLAGGRIKKTRKTDIASKLRYELSSDVTNHWVSLQILYSFHLDTPFARLHALFDSCNVNDTCTGRLIPV